MSTFTWNNLRARLSGGNKSELTGFNQSLRQYLESTATSLHISDDLDAVKAFCEKLDWFLASETESIQELSLFWLLSDLIRPKYLPAHLHQEMLEKLLVFKTPKLATPLLNWLEQLSPEDTRINTLLLWLTRLDYPSEAAQEPVIRQILNVYLKNDDTREIYVDALTRLDKPSGLVTTLLLQMFPLTRAESNTRIIYLLGKFGRFRVVKPLISYSRENPDTLRHVMKAFCTLNFDEVNQFYLDCLTLNKSDNAIVLIEAVKQVRKRRLRKAIPILEEMFPINRHASELVNRTINGEIALTLASFGDYAWAREKLLVDMMLSGVNSKYLKAIELLGLEEAVPYLKAILLMPETPQTESLQNQAYRICEQLLFRNKVS